MSNINKNDLRFLPQFNYNPYSQLDAPKLNTATIIPSSSLNEQIEKLKIEEPITRAEPIDTGNRIGRIRYLRSLLTNSLLASLTLIIGLFYLLSETKVSNSDASVIIFSIFFPYLRILWQTRKRLHDVEINGLYAFWTLIPCANILFFIFLIFCPGQEQNNKYGEPEKPNVGLDMAIIIGVICACVFAWLFIQDSIMNSYSDEYDYYSDPYYYSEPHY